MRTLPAALLILSLAAFAGAQSPADALRAEPKGVALADIPDEYRAVTLGGNGELSPWLLFGAYGGGSNNRPSERLLFRSLGAFWVQPDEFAELLDGKRARIRGYRLDLASFTGLGSGSNVVPEFSESWLEAGRIVTWSPAPELSKAALTKAFAEAGAGASEATVIESSEGPTTPEARLSNVKQAATATMIYGGDTDDIFPKADSSAKFYEAILPYIKNRSIVAPSPEAGRLLYNTHLSGVNRATIELPAETLLLWEERAWPDGKRAVAFTDGHAKRLDAAEWAQAWDRELKRRDAARPKRAK